MARRSGAASAALRKRSPNVISRTAGVVGPTTWDSVRAKFSSSVWARGCGAALIAGGLTDRPTAKMPAISRQRKPGRTRLLSETGYGIGISQGKLSCSVLLSYASSVLPLLFLMLFLVLSASGRFHRLRGAMPNPADRAGSMAFGNGPYPIRPTGFD